jgi:NADH-quinone oxidoreductase subunit M
MNIGFLTLIVFLPAGAALILSALAGRISSQAVKVMGLGASALVLMLAATLPFGFLPGAGFQFNETASWIPQLGVSYKVGIDGISLLMVLLTAFLVPLALLTAWSGSTKNEKGLTISMLFLETAMMGVFVSLDLFLFYMFWEASLIPMFFIIGVWGGSRRIRATMKFFLFTMAGSVLMLAALISLVLINRQNTGVLTFDYTLLSATRGAFAVKWLFWAFFAAFAVKIPTLPVHTWLPDAHTEAPTAGSVILAGVLLKMGGYGMVRFCAGLFPSVAVEYRLLLSLLGVAGIIYGALMVLVQKDLKRLVAYSSVSHMGYVVAGLASFTVAGMGGGVLQMVSHGLATGGLFAIVGILYERVHTRELSAYGGISRVMPHFSWLFLVVTLASMGFPGTSGFISEFMVLLGLWKLEPLLAGLAVPGVVLGAVYMLMMFRSVMQGPVHPGLEKLHPLDGREVFILSVLAAGVIIIGVWPGPWIDLIQGDILRIIGGAGGAG